MLPPFSTLGIPENSGQWLQIDESSISSAASSILIYAKARRNGTGMQGAMNFSAAISHSTMTVSSAGCIPPHRKQGVSLTKMHNDGGKWSEFLPPVNVRPEPRESLIPWSEEIWTGVSGIESGNGA